MSEDILLDIPELLKIFMHSVPESDLNELQEILMHREKLMKTQIQDLNRDLHAAKREAHLLENIQSLAELRSEEKLQRSQTKCHQLAQTINDTQKVADKTISDKDTLIIQLNQEIHNLKNTNSEINEQLVELKRKQAEKDKELDELKRQNLAERVGRMETGLGNILNVNAGDLASLAAFTDKFAADGKNVDFPDMIKSWKHRRETNVAAAILDCGASDDAPLVIPEGGRNEDGAIRVGSHGNSSAQDATNPAAAYISTAPVDNPAERSGGGEDDLETKRRRVMAGGGSVHACHLCGVVCNSATFFNSHKSMIHKHAS